jgi:hypothetical protein
MTLCTQRDVWALGIWVGDCVALVTSLVGELFVCLGGLFVMTSLLDVAIFLYNVCDRASVCVTCGSGRALNRPLQLWGPARCDLDVPSSLSRVGIPIT